MSIKVVPGETTAASPTPPPSSLVRISIEPRRATTNQRKRGDLTARLVEAAAQSEPATAAPAPAPSAPQPEAALTAAAPDRAAPVAAATGPALPAASTEDAVAPTAGGRPTAVATRVAAPALAVAPPAAAAPSLHSLEAASPGREPKAHIAEDIVAYWQGLRRGASVPDLAKLDRATVAATWSNSLLLAFGPHHAGTPPEPGAAKITRLGNMTDDVEYTPMVIDSILSLGRRAVDYSGALQEVLTFPLSSGMTRCRLILLPLTGASGLVDHVLCRLSRAATGSSLDRRD